MVIEVIAKESAVRTAIIIAIIAIDALAISVNSMQQLLARCYRQRKCSCYGCVLMHVFCMFCKDVGFNCKSKQKVGFI